MLMVRIPHENSLTGSKCIFFYWNERTERFGKIGTILSDLAISVFDLGALESKKHRDFVEYERSRPKIAPIQWNLGVFWTPMHRDQRPRLRDPISIDWNWKNSNNFQLESIDQKKQHQKTEKFKINFRNLKNWSQVNCVAILKTISKMTAIRNFK